MAEMLPAGLLDGLRNYWYPVLPAREVGVGEPVAITRLSERLVVWRDSTGAAHTFRDRCAHRGVPLSVGRIRGDRLECRYHGFQYDGGGQCRLVPSENEGDDGPTAREVCVTSYRTEETGGAIWVYLGEPMAFPPPAVPVEPEMVDSSFEAVLEPMVWDANWLLTWDNGEPSHVPFLHGDTFLLGMGQARVEPIRSEITPEGNVLTYRASTDKDDRWTGETFDATEFVLPALARLWVPVPGGGPLLRVLQWMYPIDRDHTYVLVWHGRKCANDMERQMWRMMWDKVIWPNAQEVFAQDNEIVSSQGDVRQAWGEEYLVPSDAGVVLVRKTILDAYDAQQRERSSKQPKEKVRS